MYVQRRRIHAVPRAGEYPALLIAGGGEQRGRTPREGEKQ